MADFWKDLGDEVKSGMDWLTEKTEGLVDSGKKSLSKIQLQTELDKAYQELGRTFFTMSEAGNLEINQLKENCKKIEDIQKQLEELNQG